jgi:hypothetical protein
VAVAIAVVKCCGNENPAARAGSDRASNYSVQPAATSEAESGHGEAEKRERARFGNLC